MTFPDTALALFRSQHRFARVIPAAIAVAAVLAVATLLLGGAGTAHAESPSANNDCTGLSAITLTASNSGSVSGSSAAISGNCSVALTVERDSAMTTLTQAEAAAPGFCTVTAAPSLLEDHGVRVAVAHSGDCNGVRASWRVYPPTPSVESLNRSLGDKPQATAQRSAYAYLLGEDFVGIDMIKNWSRADWTYNTDSVLVVHTDPDLWATIHAIYVLGLYLGDGWTVESEDSGTVRHGGGRVEAWSEGNFHVHIPVLPDSRADTRSELHVQSKGAFFCEFELQWTNSYAFTSESECASY